MEDFYYIVVEKSKTVFEMPASMAITYAKVFNLPYYTHYPYAEFGYEDPYNFTNEWEVYNTKNQRITYGLSYAGVEEVLQ